MKKAIASGFVGVVAAIFITCICSSSSSGQKIAVHSPAPDFRMEDVYGTIVDLASLKGKKVMLSFMRYVSCPACNYRFHELSSAYDSLHQSGYELIVVYESEPELLRKYLETFDPPFTVIGDPDRELYKLYGLQRSTFRMIWSVARRETRKTLKKGNELYGNRRFKKDGKRNSMPADFIISEKGKIEIAYYGKNISDHLPIHPLPVKLK